MVRGLIACLLTSAAVIGSAAWVATSDRPARQVTSARAAASLVSPARVAKPAHLATTYVAPPGLTAVALGRLRVARLGVDASVPPVGWDGEAMAVPNDPDRLGWFEPSARLDDLAGVSLIAGHVSDASDRPGPLASLVRARLGDVVEWRGSRGGIARFRVVSIQRFLRAAGLPTSLFRVDGPHTLRLVTCSGRVNGPSGIHYTDNLVVSAVAAGA